MEQLPLLPEGLILVFAGVSGRHLEGHILIRDFGDIGDEENARETEDKATDGEVDPLHALQGGHGIVRLGEEDIRAQDGTDDRADGIEGLGEVDADFRVAGWTADWQRSDIYSIHLI